MGLLVGHGRARGRRHHNDSQGWSLHDVTLGWCIYEGKKPAKARFGKDSCHVLMWTLEYKLLCCKPFVYKYQFKGSWSISSQEMRDSERQCVFHATQAQTLLYFVTLGLFLNVSFYLFIWLCRVLLVACGILTVASLVVCRLGGCGSQAQLPRSMQDPQLGMEPESLALKGGFLAP